MTEAVENDEVEGVEEAQAEEQRPKVKESVDSEQLKCMLTDEELLDYAQQQSAALAELEDLDNQKQSFNSSIKSKVNICNEKIGSLANKIREKAEYREVDTRTIEDYDNKTISVTRLDTDEVIIERGMTRSEFAKVDNLFFKEEIKENQAEVEDTFICDICSDKSKRDELVKINGVLNEDDFGNYSYDERRVIGMSNNNNICATCAEELIADAGGAEVGE